MKKIFAIALAVVMVLSMASAFALSACATWNTNWDCVADQLYCGKGSVEVVPYVKVNTACGWEYQVSDCASAIRSENVYYAIKVTVEAYPDEAWWTEAELELDTTGLLPAFDEVVVFDLFENLVDFESDEEVVWYFSQGKGWMEEDDDFELKDAMWASKVNPDDDVCSNEAYDVCATLSSYYDGFSVAAYNVAGDYFYGLISATDGSIVAKKALSTEGMDDQLVVWDEDGNTVIFTIEDGAIKNADWTNATSAFYNKVMADFGFVNCGTSACLYEKNFFNNFGWDDAQKDCFSWSTKGASVVDTDCVVAIPKTGDASVLAWLF